MNDIMKIVQALENSNILLKGITKTIENETKEQKWVFLGELLGLLGASLLGNMLPGKGISRASYGNKEGKGIVRVCYGSKDLRFKKKTDSAPSFNKHGNITRSIIRLNLDLMEFFLEITCLKT